MCTLNLLTEKNRSAPDADENSSKDMGLIIDGMKKSQRIVKVVICVHHTGKDVSKGLRGHYFLSCCAKDIGNTG